MPATVHAAAGSKAVTAATMAAAVTPATPTAGVVGVAAPVAVADQPTTTAVPQTKGGTWWPGELHVP